VSPLARRRPRGVTLIELMVAVAISAIVLASLFGVVQSQQRAFFQGQLQRAAQGSARAALTYVEQRVALAGYGLDAPLAFDFQWYGSAQEPMPCPALADGCPRDSVNGNDELVFYARNPRYWVPEDRSGIVQPSGNAWRVLTVGDGSIDLTARPGDIFEKGRILQVVCNGGGNWAYMTVAAKASATNPTAPALLTVPLVASSDTNPFRRQAYARSMGCFSDGSARAFLIDRFRFHVRPVQGPSDLVPYLVLDTGLDPDGDGPEESEETIVAEGIESFQVAYVLTNGDSRGTTPGTAITFASGTVFSQLPPPATETGSATGTGLTLTHYDASAPLFPGKGEYESTSWYRYPVGPVPVVAPQRLTDNQANIRAVKISIVARGAEPDPGRGSDLMLPLLNQNALPAWNPARVAYDRARVEATVSARNMIARGMNDF
jgi:type IV pilus assembly protein PilW